MTPELREQARLNIEFEKTLRDKFDAKKKKRIENDLFPHKEIDEEWLTFAKKNLKYVSLLTAQLPIEDFERAAFYQNTKKLTLAEIGALCNVFEVVSADQMGVPLNKFCQLQRITAKIAGKWNAIVNTISNELADQAEQEIIAYHAKKTGSNATPLMQVAGEA